jgi:aminopeptidase N
MLESYMGIEDLRQGLKIYLNKHKFKNAVTKDLWEALAAATNNTKDIEVKTLSLISPIS